MESTRQRKFARLIQKELSEVFYREGKDIIGNNTLVTITIVRATPDLGQVRVYLSFLPEKNAKLLIEDINEQAKQIKHVLAGRIRHQVRVIPDLQFYLDDTAQEASRINSLIDGLNIPPAPPEEEAQED